MYEFREWFKIVLRTERFKVDLSSCECKLGISRGGPCGNKITRPHSSLKWHSRGRRYNSLHPGSSSTSHCSFGSLFIFTSAIYVAKINDWRKRVSDDTLLKIQPQAACVAPRTLMSHGNYVWKNKKGRCKREDGEGLSMADPL